MKKSTKPRFECVGGPLCGKHETPIKSEVGIPAFAYDDPDGQTHYYRLARAGKKRYWHYLGVRGVDMSIKPCMRPLSEDT